MIYWGTRRKKWVLRPGRSKQTAVLTVCGSEYLHLYFWMVNPVLKVLIDFLHNLGHLNIIIDENAVIIIFSEENYDWWLIYIHSFNFQKKIDLW